LYNKNMDTYDPRYLAGILFFNAQDFFEAHEAWEDLWSESHGNERRFYQGLIQAAVALFHFSNGNLGGAVKQYRSSYDYMKTCGSPFLGLDVDDFWQRMAVCFEQLLKTDAPDRSSRPDPALIPNLTLDPPPEEWPDPEAYIHEEE
jgi:predicted metal-dependent hydrolase